MKLEDLFHGSNEDGDCGRPDDAIPEWLDRGRFFRGQKFFQDHVVAHITAFHCSLVCGLAVSSLLQALVFTHQSDTPRKSLKRYLVTFYHLLLWLTGDVWDDTESREYKSVRRVREIHAGVRKAMNSAHPGTMHLSQYDMAIVQSGFMAAITMYPEGFGVIFSKQDLEDYIHFWRGIGFILGIDDRYNICSGDYAETYSICKEIESEILVPDMESPPHNFHQMAQAFCEGMNLFTSIPLCSNKSIFAYVYEVMGRPVPRLSWPDQLRFWFYKTVRFCTLRIPLFEKIMNYLFMRQFHAGRKHMM